jgi:hypothetical protein
VVVTAGAIFLRKLLADQSPRSASDLASGTSS